jgi:fatty acid desaturase
VKDTALSQDRREIKSALRNAGVDLSLFATATSGWHLARYALTCWGAATLAVLFLLSGEPIMIAGGIVGLAIAQHAMLNVTHEACHFTLLRDRRMNDLVGNIGFALPIGTTVAHYRLRHERHHRHLGDDLDPVSPLIAADSRRIDVVRALLLLLFGKALFDLVLDALKGRAAENRSQDEPNVGRLRFGALLAFHVPIFLLLAIQGLALVWLIWMLVAATLVPFLDGLRTVAEHRFADHHDDLDHTRVHHTSVLISAIAAPFLQYHWEHHLFPSIPHSRLAAFHRLLIALNVKRATPLAGGFPQALAEGFRE